jgi:hypothetical protein
MITTAQNIYDFTSSIMCLFIIMTIIYNYIPNQIQQIRVKSEGCLLIAEQVSRLE